MIFVSYSWIKSQPDEEVLILVNNLRENGYDASCDVMYAQQEASISFPQMMAENLARANNVIIVLSKEYKEKADSFKGGVGEEYRYIISDISKNKQKYILVSFTDNLDDVVPDFLIGREVIALDRRNNGKFDRLLHRINNTGEYGFSEVNPVATIPATRIVGYMGASADRLLENIAQAKETYALLEEYLNFEDVKPIVSYGSSTAINIISEDNAFNADIDVNDCSSFGKQEFVMVLLKYIPSENWRVFWDANYRLEFDITSSSGVIAFQLEIKDSKGNKIVDKKISANLEHHSFSMQKLSRRANAWDGVNEICFTVFINEQYLSERKGHFAIRELKLVAS